MKFAVSTLRRAESDISRIYAWIAERSNSGASHWYEAAYHAIDSLAQDAEQHSLAPEGELLGIDLREKLFKTPRGRYYRILYMFDDVEVRVLRVRGPGQAPVSAEDISE